MKKSEIVTILLVIGLILSAIIFLIIAGLSEPSFPPPNTPTNEEIQDTQDTANENEKLGTNIASIQAYPWEYTICDIVQTGNIVSWKEININTFICYEIIYFQNGKKVIININQPFIDIGNLDIDYLLIRPLFENCLTESVKFIIPSP